MSKLHGIKYPCDSCGGIGWIVHDDPKPEVKAVKPKAEKPKKKDKLPIIDEVIVDG